ncbi:Crp/Fnr family transcriptional regulator [Brachyspira hampsonii]|uniref:cyclic nucleotide-binding domain-containing protein n=2 Tax=Brachyspira hampsonii TaxID=1287055 RepID=UPI000851D8DB|nr:cyclic nucleotide-binding domain-containing protein [Brachyspira hampsonii]OEJ19368.1 Crp/Fnr family transcriptional regulator [Brachyspira hampsonii]
MINYNKVQFKKSSIIFIDGQEAKNYFYIITKGSIISYNYFSENYNMNYKKGDIIGLVNAAINVPYFATSKAEEDSEAIEINIAELHKINNINIIEKIYNHISTLMELWLNQYYFIFSKEKNINCKKENTILEMAEIYKNNGFDDAALKLYNKYIEKNGETEELKKIISKIKPSNTACLVIEGIYKLDKGTCIFTELETTEKLYIIMSGKIGVYSIFNSKQITRIICSDNEVFSGYASNENNDLLLTTAIALEDTIIKILKREDMLELVKTDRALREYSIKFFSMRIYNIMRNINSFKIKNIIGKFMLVLESIVKKETLFKETNTLNLKYNVYDILSITGVQYNEYSSREIKKIKTIKIDDNGNIIIPDIKKFIKEYDRFQKINFGGTEDE